METFIHTPEGELKKKKKDPILGVMCQEQKCPVSLDHDPVPCIGADKDPCQCTYCTRFYDRNHR